MTDPENADSLALVGTTIAEKYAIESVVGTGGFAIVYRATHVLWKRPVAVKVFKALGEVAEHERQKLLDDFIREGSLLAELSERSTAICQARDVGMHKTKKGDTVPYMVLEWLEGKTLEGVLEEEKRLGLPLRSLEQAIRLLDPAAEALALAHKKGIAHRDVKPANVFVLGDARSADVGVKLLDFGIAKVVQDAQKMGFGKTAGHITSFTPLYGAPEQFNRAYGATGPWTDVFALALVFTEVVSGDEPMVGDNLVQLAVAAADPKFRPTPRAHRVATTDEVEAIFLKALAVNPEERFQTVGEFWSALRTRVIGDPMSAISSSRPSQVAAVNAEGATVVDPGAGPAAAASYRSGAYPNPTSATAQAPSSPIAAGGTLAAAAPAPAKSRTPLVAGAAVLALVAIGGGVFALKGGGGAAKNEGAATASAIPTVSSAASSVSAPAVGPAASCPSGMIFIPGGEFFMGSDEKDATDPEKPPHRVKLRPYCLDEFEVTVAQYKKCSDEGGCRRAGKENVWDGIKPAQKKIYDPLCNINDPIGKAKHPINCVDWDQAREMCESRGGRLPTEAEWEFAARGPDGRIYPWGDDPPSAQLLNACGAECVNWQKKHPDPDGPPASMYAEDDGFPNTAPVGSFPKGKSRYGIQDVVGNVWEWVSDYYAPYDKAKLPAASVDPKGPPTGVDRVIRGGSWNGSEPSWVRPSFRFHVAPSARSYGFGFRCAKSI